MKEITNYNENIFEGIKHIDEYGLEYWEARELQKALEYVKWENFHKIIKKAIIACENSNNRTLDHFPEFRKPIIGGKGNVQGVIDYRLSRYACYLIVQNGDPKKEVIALGQTYFAIQTRRQEITDKVAKEAGVKNFDKFHNAGYKGLYNGETADDIAKRKRLRYREDILDKMGSTELAANLFRITQTEAKLRKDEIKGERNACKTHNKIGENVRKFMLENSGIAPEELPTPEKSLKELEKESKVLLK